MVTLENMEHFIATELADICASEGYDFSRAAEYCRFAASEMPERFLTWKNEDFSLWLYEMDRCVTRELAADSGDSVIPPGTSPDRIHIAENGDYSLLPKK